MISTTTVGCCEEEGNSYEHLTVITGSLDLRDTTGNGYDIYTGFMQDGFYNDPAWVTGEIYNEVVDFGGGKLFPVPVFAEIDQVGMEGPYEPYAPGWLWLYFDTSAYPDVWEEELSFDFDLYVDSQFVEKLTDANAKDMAYDFNTNSCYFIYYLADRLPDGITGSVAELVHNSSVWTFKEKNFEEYVLTSGVFLNSRTGYGTVVLGDDYGELNPAPDFAPEPGVDLTISLLDQRDSTHEVAFGITTFSPSENWNTYEAEVVVSYQGSERYRHTFDLANFDEAPTGFTYNWYHNPGVNVFDNGVSNRDYDCTTHVRLK